MRRARVGHAQKLNGAGATFPYPIYSKWFSEYSASHPGVQINYQSIGSGGGIRQVTAGTVDFGASDGPMTDQQLRASKVKIQHIPTVLGAVVPIFNIPGVNDLRFAPDVLADIYLGKITNWSDPRIAKDNPEAKLPSLDIMVVCRSDGSGTSYIFTDYLSKVSKDWAAGPGRGTSPAWPRGIRAKGNEGVAGFVRQSPGAIGYVELIYALSEQDSLRLHRQYRRKLGAGLDRRRDGGRGQPQEHARGLSGFHHQCAGKGRLSHFELYLASDSQPGQGFREWQSGHRFPQVDARA